MRRPVRRALKSSAVALMMLGAGGFVFCWLHLRRAESIEGGLIDGAMGLLVIAVVTALSFAVLPGRAP